MRGGVEKLRRYPPDYHGIGVAGLLRTLEPWLDRLARQQPLDSLPFPTIRPASTEAMC